MKKWICLFVTMILCLAGSAFAENEDFQLRNGIVFGDTMDIVKQKETLPEINYENESELQYEGTIAGIDGSVEYYFDEENGKLTDMLYSFSAYSSRDFMNSDYSKLKESLLRKYGTPLGNIGGDLYLITGKAPDEFGAFVGTYIFFFNGDGDYVDYDEWIVNCNGYNVKIDLISAYARDKSYNYHYEINLSYHYYTDADYMDEVQKIQEENAAVDNDL